MKPVTFADAPHLSQDTLEIKHEKHGFCMFTATSFERVDEDGEPYHVVLAWQLPELRAIIAVLRVVEREMTEERD